MYDSETLLHSFMPTLNFVSCNIYREDQNFLPFGQITLPSQMDLAPLVFYKLVIETDNQQASTRAFKPTPDALEVFSRRRSQDLTSGYFLMDTGAGILPLAEVLELSVEPAPEFDKLASLVRDGCYKPNFLEIM